ncbi:helix-turn-helix transcriptional regulator [Nitrincola sp. A-D6]|uniref:helix-turn-helix transcriptional regulator n=1 Tax=Nitrincola sp. A-D6 TaxID=1545442 RepID=UPI00055A8F17|nr:AlpA family transcriptional regulator [Nitrincola sp. A-D6]
MKLLRLPAVINATGLSRSSLYRKIDAGSFPKSIRISQRSVAWSEEEVQQWIQQRFNERELPQRPSI